MTSNQLHDDIFTATLKDALTALNDMKKRSVDDPHEPACLPLKEMELLPNVFQVRGGLIDEHHVSSLRAVLIAGRDLDPLTMWRCGRHAFLVDGHHRLQAYSLHQEKNTEPLIVPVRWYRGSAADAVRLAAEANTKLKLAMTHAQRANLAWRLNLAGSFSKADIATVAGVSVGLVSTMRRAQKGLGDDADLYEAWWEAHRAYKGKDEKLSHEDVEVMVEQQAREWADRMAKTFSTKLATNPTIAVRALDLYFGRKAAEVIRLWADELGADNVFDDEHDAVDPPF